MARAQLVWVAVLVGAAALVSGTPARKSKEVSNDYEYQYEYDSDGPVAVTCPGFPGYCSESYVGATCTVVCARGRNNVPQCQEDGTWTDIPRCVEHDPGVEEQVTGICPGIPGYCSLNWPGALCEFECPLGPAIRSSCTPDGTWEPYPTCEGDPRETHDGCNPCPGPGGGPRNRTIEGGGGNGGRAKAANRGNNNIPRNGGKKQGAGGSRSGGTGSTNTGQREGSRNAGQRGGSRNAGQSGLQGEKQNVGGQNRNPLGGEQNRRQNGGQSQNRVGTESRSPSSANQTGGQSRRRCPGDELQACIDVCPGFTARIFGLCVAGCAKRCPARK